MSRPSLLARLARACDERAQSDLQRRLVEHYAERGKSNTFTGRYYCYNLVYYEWYQYATNAILREKELKKMLREHKVALIEEANADWKFFNAFICGKWPPDPPEEQLPH